jgi:hypothetical protein
MFLKKIKFLNVDNFDNSNTFKISLYMIYIWDSKETLKHLELINFMNLNAKFHIVF